MNNDTKKILITGMTGFVGPHLADFIFKLPAIVNYEVWGTVRNRSNLSKIPLGVKIIECELTDTKNVDDVIFEIKPDFIFHLAAQSFVYSSWKSPADTLMNNIISELNILEAIRKFAPNCIIQIAGSSEEYGMPKNWPILESHELKPLSPYGVSKVAQEKLGFQYFKSYGLKVILTRAFNHTGPGRDPRFAEASFAQQITYGQNQISVGNLEAVRDYTDVRDMVRAYWLAANSINYGVPMNICSGVGYKIREILDKLIYISGKKVEVIYDPLRLRPSDIEVLIGDCSFFKTLTGWEPEYNINKTLKDLYESFTNN